MFKYTLTLGTEKRKAGAVRFFVSTYKINKDKELNFTSDDEKTLESFLTLINSENKSVSTMHDKATAQEASDGDTAKIIEQLA
jgi:predicted NUDIX family phosphoesterase